MINTIQVYINYFLFQLKMGLKNLVIHRANVFFIVIFEILDCIGIMVFIEVIFGNISNVAGWTKNEFYILFGTYYIQAELASCIYINGLDSFTNKIRDGTLDYYLTKPISSVYLCMASRISLNKLIPLIIPFYMVIKGIGGLDLHPNIPVLTIYSLLAITGIFLKINLVSIIMALGFWTIKIRSFFSLTFTLITYAQYPKEIYNKPLSVIFTFIIPVILITNPAAFFILGRDYKYLLLLLVIMSCITFIVSKILWKKGLDNYQSASS